MPAAGVKSETGRPQRVLLVEDDDGVREVLSDALRQAGYELDCARTYAEAQHAIARRPHDLVVTDVRLPDGRGYDLLSRARTAGSKMIFISGHVTHMPSAEASRVICLAKPFRLETLLEQIELELAAPDP